jgi:hypothetical protein
MLWKRTMRSGSVVLPVVKAELFGDELFPAVGVLGHGGIDVLFLQGDDVGLGRR